MSKLLEDEKFAKLVDREVVKAVKADRRRILDGLKEIKTDYVDEEPAIKRAANAVVTSANKVVREVA